MADSNTPTGHPMACVQCHAKGNNPKKCSSCLAVTYCSVECQAAAWKKHKMLCGRIRKHRQLVSSLEAKLKKDLGEAFFGDQQGAFWSFPEAREYCCALHVLGLDLVKMGEAEGNLKAFEEAEKIYSELLRLSHRDEPGIRALYPFVLIALGRLQDAYGFIKWWATVDKDGLYNWNKGPKLQKGQWMYPKNEDITEDILNVPGLMCKGACYTSSMDPFHQMALILLKLKLIKDLTEKLKESSSAAGAVDVRKTLRDQETQLSRLVRSLQSRCAYALDALLKEQGLGTDQPEAMVIVENTIEEGLAVKMAALYLFNKIGGRARLENLVDKYPATVRNWKEDEDNFGPFCVWPPVACVPLRFSPLIPQRFLEPAVFGSPKLGTCVVCGKESLGCIKCPRCSLSTFCSAACQATAEPRHAGFCRKVVEAKKDVTKEAQTLERKMGKNFIQKNMGALWVAAVEARKYCRAVQYLALAYKGLGEAEENQLAFHAAEKEYLELMRMNHSELQGSRYVYPFILLTQERYQDCYDFVKWVLVTSYSSNYDWETIPKRLGKGQWSYFRGEDVMEDMRRDRRMVVCKCELPISMDNILLMALILLKLKIIEELKEGRLLKLGAGEEMWTKSVYPQLLGPSMLKKQERILGVYGKAMQKFCPSALSFVADVERILATRESPETYCNGSDDEAYLIAALSKFAVKKMGLRSKIADWLKTLPTFRKEQLNDRNRCCPPMNTWEAQLGYAVGMSSHSPLIPYTTPMEDPSLKNQLFAMAAQMGIH